MQGKVDPDEFYVHKPTFRQGHRAVLRRLRGQKQVRMICAKGHHRLDHARRAHHRRRSARASASTTPRCWTLADNAIRIEEHYSAHAGHTEPMDIEWAKDADDGKLYIVQARPETVASRRAAGEFESYALTGSGKVLVTGKAVGEKIGTGTVRVIHGHGGPAGLPARRGAGRHARPARTGSR